MRFYGLRDDPTGTNQEPMTWATKGYVGVTARNNRRFVEAVFYHYPAGITWRDLPQ